MGGLFRASYLFYTHNPQVMATLNPIIIDALKAYFNEKSDMPKAMQDLIEKLLAVEVLPSSSKSGIDKLYDQILDRFVSNTDLVEWSKKYVNK